MSRGDKSSYTPQQERREEGRIGWVLLWLLGIPIPILLGPPSRAFPFYKCRARPRPRGGAVNGEAPEYWHGSCWVLSRPTEGERMHARYCREFQTQHTVLTLGDAVAAVSAVTTDEREVVAVVLHMLRRQSIRLVGMARSIDRAGHVQGGLGV